MTRFLAIVSVFIFIFAAVLGVYAMNHQTCFDHNGCLFEAIQNNLSLNKEEIFSLAFLIFTLVGVVSFFSSDAFSGDAKLFLYSIRWFFNRHLSSELKLSHWLSIRLNSPNSL